MPVSVESSAETITADPITTVEEAFDEEDENSLPSVQTAEEAMIYKQNDNEMILTGKT